MMNKYFSAFIILAVVVVSALLCSTQAIGAEEDPFEIMKKEKIGSLKIEMSAKQVIELLGKPGRQSPVTFEAATGNYVSNWEYEGKGISLKMASESEKGEMKIDSITISTSCKFKTAKGMGIGNSKVEVEKAYTGYPIDKDFTTEDQLVIGSVYGGLFFTFKNGKVNGIFLGAGAE